MREKRDAWYGCKGGGGHTIKPPKREKVCLRTLLSKEEKGGEQGEKFGGPGCHRSDLCDNGGKNFPAMASSAFTVEDYSILFMGKQQILFPLAKKKNPLYHYGDLRPKEA